MVIRRLLEGNECSHRLPSRSTLRFLDAPRSEYRSIWDRVCTVRVRLVVSLLCHVALSQYLLRKLYALLYRTWQQHDQEVTDLLVWPHQRRKRRACFARLFSS